ncbi:Glycoside hydrolase, 38 vacuolar alpha mannosidase [Saitozyma podzolica]|uniref:Glycoside hydrolase, 38 vacuolar alpha mannosidase n=1 Tax=Saitozyma podzolica TaxID=1890683 RepID=A0A427YFE6_9TREE|nr:Glycoside hydrolase, 38 vacuolar alpha mannosidase [Saitozyma podzolica]
MSSPAERLKYDFETLHQLSEVLPAQSPLANKARMTADNIMNAFDGTLESVTTCRELAEECLGKDWEARQVKTRGAKGVDPDGGPFVVDADRPYGKVPGAPQYKWLETLYPKVFERLKQKVKKDQFEVTRGAWVECNSNMPSSKTLSRQFLLGQRYFKSRLGFYCDTLVLPDTFGYVAQLPQLVRLSGCSSFFAQKLSWNATNLFPSTTFNWVCLRGSEVLTHMATVVNYCSQCDDKYPKGTLELLWEDLCRNKFHDTLPGSSINLCVKDSDGKYREVQATGKELLDSALAALITQSTDPDLAIGEASTGVTGAIIKADHAPAVVEEPGDGFIFATQLYRFALPVDGSRASRISRSAGSSSPRGELLASIFRRTLRYRYLSARSTLPVVVI